MEISNSTVVDHHQSPSISQVTDELLTTKEQEKTLPNYTVWVQEAIVALTSGDKTSITQGCSLLGIFLYILNNYSTEDSIFVMNTKIRSTLALLNRMGIVQRSGEDENDEDELECVSTLPKSDIEQPMELDGTQAAVSGKAKPTLKVNKSTTAKKPKDAEKSVKAKKKDAAAIIVKKAKLGAKSKAATKIVTSKKKKDSGGKENSTAENKAFPFHLKTMKKLSPALATVCGKKKMGRHEVVREIWIYIKKHQLQDPAQKSVIICDDKLKAVTKKKRVTCSEILSCLAGHMTTI